MNVEDLKLLAKNLANPDGEKGIEVAEMMNATNISMTLESIKSMEPNPADHILEIGHGNAGHFEQLLKQADNLSYTGLDILETMRNEAVEKNKAFRNQAEFMVYDGRNIPFEGRYFDKIFMDNTLYFWISPPDFLNEIYRVLNFVLTFGQKDFMENLPFTSYGFQLYNNNDVQELINKSEFSEVTFTQKEEWIKSKTGDEPVKRRYTILTIKK